MSFLHSPNVIHCVSADEVPWPQESPTNFEKPHFAMTDKLKVLKVISDILHPLVYHKMNSLQAQTHQN